MMDPSLDLIDGTGSKGRGITANEQVYNRLLRRIDWRLLLPNPWPTRVVCSASGSLARAVEVVSDSISEWPKIGHSDFDLAVARDPSSGALKEAWEALRPGGHCYTEWHRLWPNGASRARRHLLEAGFTDVACYWPNPPRMPTQYWLPLDSPPTIERWWIRQQYLDVTGNRIVDLLRRLVRTLMLMAALKASVATPICVLARKPLDAEARLGAVHDGQGGPVDLNELIRARWASWGFGPSPDRLAWILATGGRHSSNKVVGIISAASDGVPRLVVKMPRVPESLASLESESEALALVHAGRPGGMPGVPKVLFYEAHDGFARLGETYLEGVPLFIRLNEGNYRDYAIKATDWLVALAGRPERRVSKAWWDHQVGKRLAALDSAVGQIVDGSVLQRTREVLAAVNPLPSVCEHRDFSPWNVLVTPGGDLAVLDWESAEVNGLPALDLIYFLAYLAFFLDGAMESGRYLESYRLSLNGSTFTGRVRAECLARYASAVGLDPAVLEQLGLFAWLIHASTEYSRLKGEGKPAIAMAGSPFIALGQEDLLQRST